MSKKAITIKDSIITGIHEYKDELIFEEESEFYAHEIREVSAQSEYIVGVDVKAFTEDGRLRPLAEIVAEGYTRPPDGHVLVDNEFVPIDPDMFKVDTESESVRKMILANNDLMIDLLLDMEELKRSE